MQQAWRLRESEENKTGSGVWAAREAKNPRGKTVKKKHELSLAKNSESNNKNP